MFEGVQNSYRINRTELVQKMIIRENTQVIKSLAKNTVFGKSFSGFQTRQLTLN